MMHNLKLNYTLSFLGEQVDMGWGQKMFIKCLGEGLPTGIVKSYAI